MEKLNWELETEDGFRSVIFVRSGNSKKYIEDPLHPEEEALRALAGRLDDIDILIAPPLAKETIQALFQHSSSLRLIYIVDRYSERLGLWRKNNEISDSSKIKVIELSGDKVGAAEALSQSMNIHTASLFLGRGAVYVPSRFRRIDREFAEFIEKTVLHIQREACTSASFQTTRLWHITMNKLFNMDFKNALKIDKSSVRAGSSPVVITGAGPSLDYTAPILKKYQERAIIIATDASLKNLLANDIIPDFVVTLEDLHLSWRFFAGLKEQSIPLIFPLSANSFLARNYKGPVIMVNAPGSNDWTEHVSGLLDEINGGQCVGHFAFHAAEFLNPSEIIMTGFDLAFRDGRFHSSGMATPYLKDRPESFTTIEVDGVNGAKVKTDISMSFYIKYFEEKISTCKCPVIDATEGGAIKRGAIIKTLEESLRNHKPKEKIRLMPNKEFNTFNQDNFCMNIRTELLAIKRALEDDIVQTGNMTAEKVFNPFKKYRLDSQAFRMMTSCSNAMILAAFGNLADNYSPKNFKSYANTLKLLIEEFIEAAGLLVNMLDLRHYKAEDRTKTLFLAPDGISAAKLGLQKYIEINSESTLPQIWKKIKECGVGRLIAVNGAIIPDMWSVPGLDVYDIKTSFEPLFYERSLWIPGYNLACIDELLYEKWRNFVPNDVNCRLLKDLSL